MQKILVVFTGGTIGSIVINGITNVARNSRFQLIELFQAQNSTYAIEFDCIQPLHLLSENNLPSTWTALIQAIEAQPLASYAGIIVTHGTDTLAFSAAALAIYFHALKKPLLLVSSNYPLADPQANGLDNFSCAVSFIQQQVANGVFVAYQNPEQTMQVHLGARLASSLQLSSDFMSVQAQAYMEFVAGKFKLNTPLNPVSTQYKLTSKFSTRILIIKPYPGLNYSYYDLDQVDVILHDLYHSGTACSTDLPKNDLKHFIQKCQQQSKPIYLAPAIKSASCYHSTHSFIQSGAQILWNISLEVAYVKLLFAYAQFNTPLKISKFLETNLAQEQLAVIV